MYGQNKISVIKKGKDKLVIKKPPPLSRGV